MTEEEIFEFDLAGYIVYPDLITSDDVERMNDVIDANLTDQMNPGHFGFFPGDGAGSDTCFLELMAHPRTLQIIRVMLGDWLRLDHAYAIQMTKDSDVHENLHGGLRENQGEHQYQWVYNTMYNGLIVVMYALEDVNPGDGGFICVPGSHKANINSYKPSVYSHLVANPSLKAGDMLIFTEALVHGTRKWTSDNKRRSLLYKYSPGYSTWGDPGKLERSRELAHDDLQRALLRPPYVGERTPIDFPEVPDTWKLS